MAEPGQGKEIPGQSRRQIRAKHQDKGVSILEGYPVWQSSPLPLTYLQFASIQLQELRSVHLSGSKLSSILLQVEAAQPLAHLLAGPVLYSGERLIQELW